MKKRSRFEYVKLKSVCGRAPATKKDSFQVAWKKGLTKGELGNKLIICFIGSTL